MKPHLVHSNYRCDQCNYSATRQYLLEQHKTYHECDPQVSVGPQDVVWDPYENENEVLDVQDEDEEGMEEDVDVRLLCAIASSRSSCGCLWLHIHGLLLPPPFCHFFWLPDCLFTSLIF